MIESVYIVTIRNDGEDRALAANEVELALEKAIEARDLGGYNATVGVEST